MKINTKSKLGVFAATATIMLNLSSCSYLDVVPVETAGKEDMLLTQVDALEYLYGCYGPIQSDDAVKPLRIFDLNFASDEFVSTESNGNATQRFQWNQISGMDVQINHWQSYYDAIGYCNQFIKDLGEAEIPELSELDKKQYIAEAKFLKAYFHYRVMEQYGPAVIMDELGDRNLVIEDLPGRSHIDYCADYVCKLCDEAYPDLPTKYSNPQYYSRATKAMVRMLQAKVRLLVASPIYNGEFPDKTWKNKNFETPGYGLELVSFTYDKNKWLMAKPACETAIKEAHDAGHVLFDLAGSEVRRKADDIPLPQIPGVDTSTPKGEEFAKRVMLMRYVPVCGPNEGSTEFIWGMNKIAPSIDWATLPHFIMNDQKGNRVGCWGWVNPTLYTVEHFLTKDGYLPSEDPSFKSESDWYKSANLSNTDIINLCVGREPRFYAYIGFDGDEYSPVIVNGKPLILDMKSSDQAGYNETYGPNNQSATGFMNKKQLHPNVRFTGVDNNNNLGVGYDHPFSIFRLADLYLMYAEAVAQLNEDLEEGLVYLNKVRARAGVPEVNSVTNGAELLKIVREERFAEMYLEGTRLLDIQRYVEGPERMGATSYRGLNALVTNPSFAEFNYPKVLEQPFTWDNRMYFLPIPNNELYSDPQLVQAPFY